MAVPFVLVGRENRLRLVYDPSTLVDVSALAVQESRRDAAREVPSPIKSRTNDSLSHLVHVPPLTELLAKGYKPL